jgi:hypothetical protein
MKLVALMGAAVLVGVGCVMTEPAEAPPWQLEDTVPNATGAAEPALSLRSERGAVVLRVGPEEVSGADVSLARVREDGGPALRGKAFGQVVSLSAAGGQVTGLTGARPVNLTVERIHGALHVEGTLGGEPVSFALGPHAARGRVGRRAYDLAFTGDRYEGRRGGAMGTEHVVLAVPPALACWSDEEQAAVLAILLGG